MIRATLSALAAVVFAIGLPGPVAMAGDTALAEAGKRQFLRCSGCHSMSAAAPPLFGPHLEGIVDRIAGVVEGYEYTEQTLREQSFVWDEEYFDEWLKDPQSHYPGMCMPFMGLASPEARRALVAYLKEPTP